MAASCPHSPFYCSLETSTRAQGLLEKGVVRYLHYGFSYRSFPRMNSGDSFRSKCRTLSNPGRTKVWLSTNFKASHTAFAMASDRDAIESGSLGELEKENQNGALFPDGIESFITEVCDETDIAEIKLKAGSFAMHIRRNIEKSKRPSSVASPLPAPAIPGEPMIDSDPTVTLPSSSPTPKDPPTRSFNPFTAKLSMSKTSKFGLLEAAGDEGLCFVTAPKVGIFKRSRVVKGRIGRPLCEEGQSIKEGQVVCYLDQLGGQTPITSEVSGEVVKILWSEGEPVGYGDPLIAVLPSFHGIK